jgi:hypothetical protein
MNHFPILPVLLPSLAGHRDAVAAPVHAAHHAALDRPGGC